MSETFELWAHPALGDLYAVWRRAHVVMGICGPIPLELIATIDLANCRYEDPRQAVTRIGAHRGEFVPAQQWVLGFENQALVLGALFRAARSARTAGGHRGPMEPMAVTVYRPAGEQRPR